TAQTPFLTPSPSTTQLQSQSNSPTPSTTESSLNLNRSESASSLVSATQSTTPQPHPPATRSILPKPARYLATPGLHRRHSRPARTQHSQPRQAQSRPQDQ